MLALVSVCRSVKGHCLSLTGIKSFFWSFSQWFGVNERLPEVKMMAPFYHLMGVGEEGRPGKDAEGHR